MAGLEIAVVANNNLPIPPYYGYGGTQRGVYDFLTEFNDMGHEITLFAPLSSQVESLENVMLIGTSDFGLWEPRNPLETAVLEGKITEEERLEEIKDLTQHYFDVILEDLAHTHYDIINIRSDDPELVESLIDLGLQNKIVYSLHNVRSMARLELIIDNNIQGIAHCNSHREDYGNLGNIRVIKYGINTEDYTFSPQTLTETDEEPSFDMLKELKENGQDYLIHLSCIGENKGQKTSIEIAREAGMPLVIAGTPQKRTSNRFVDYFDEHVEPEIDGETVLYFGNADEEQKKELFKYAKASLFPSGFEDHRWKEPFGRVIVESLACGTPVLAFNHGSAPEILEHRSNGFLFKTRTEAVEHITKDLDSIDRDFCRYSASTRFDKSRVAKEYENLFYEMTARNNS